MLGKIGKAVRKAAPLLLGLAGTAGGPLGAAATRAVSGALGLGEDAQEHEIEMALANAGPEELRKLRTANLQFELDMRAIDLEEVKVHAGDRSSARQREAAIRDSTPKAIAWISLLSLLGLIVLFAFSEPPAGSRDVLLVLVGILTAVVSSMKDYYFGSSREGALQGGDLADALREAVRARAEHG